MKSLKDTINECLVYEKKFTPEEKSEREAILNFIQKNYSASPSGLKILKIDGVWYVNYERGTLTVTNKSITSLTNGLFYWNRLKGTFDCSMCENLESLEGAPQVFHALDCRECKNLKSFVGVGAFDDLTCIGCDSLVSFEGLGRNLTLRYIYASNCKNLASLKGLPIKAFNLYLDDCKSLTSLKGCPKDLAILSIAGCSNIKSWDGAPNRIWEGLFYGGCKYLKDQEPPCHFDAGAKAYYGYNGTTGASMIGR